MTLRRGLVVWVSLGEGVGARQTKRRPAIVVSHDGANSAAEALGYGVVTVVPLTSQVRPPQYFQTLVSRDVSGLAKDALAQAEQIRSVDIRRVHPTTTVLPREAMEELDTALRVHLSLY